MTFPTVSVVIPAYRAARTVAAAVGSALAQTRPPAEVVVVDDGSPDDIAGALTRYACRVTLLRQPNGGVAVARNRGVAATRGDVVAFLDADDVWHPRKLELQLEVLRDHPDVALLGTGTVSWPGAFPTIPDRPALRLTPVPLDRLVVRNLFITSSVVVRRTALARAGEFDPALRGPEDHDLWLRVAERSAVANLDLPLTGYRDADGSLSKHAAQMQAGMRAILAGLDRRDVWRGRRLLRHRAYAYFHYSSAYMYRAAGRPAAAVANSLLSLAWYPLTFRAGELKMPFARLRLLARSMAQLLRSAAARSGHALPGVTP
jgi:glycosyltransferase involved in cell wall biosynthesis